MFNCKLCKKGFEGRKRKFCSKECLVKSTNVNPSIKNCKHCNKPFEIKRSKYTYCSNTCSKEGRKLSQLNRTKRPDYHKAWFDKNQDKRNEYEKQRLIRAQEEKVRKLLAGEIEGESRRIYIKQCKATGQLFVTNRISQLYLNSKIGRSVGSKIRNQKVISKKCKQCHGDYTGNHSGRYCNPCAKQRNKRNIKEHRYNAKQKRRTQKKGLTIIRRIVFESFGWICQHCGVNTHGVKKGMNLPNEPTIDHIVPLSKGGLHTYGNVQLLCRNCNTKKGARHEGTWVGKSEAYFSLESIVRPFFSGRNV